MTAMDRAGRIGWAKSYPFGHPEHSYLFRQGRAEPLEIDRALFEGRVPVIASGSNAAPRQLERKYAEYEPGAEIPVTRTHIRHFDTVYDAHLTTYGSVPATLFPSLGTVLATFITWLNETELEIMHLTEQPGVNYHFSELSGVELEVDGIGALDTAFAYTSVAGSIRHEGGPVSLAEVPASGRRYPALGQERMLELVRARVAPHTTLDDFIIAVIEDAQLRRAHSRALAADAHPFAHGAMRRIEVGEDHGDNR